MPAVMERPRPRDVGMGLVILLCLLAFLFMFGKSRGWWEERYLLLATVRDARELMVGAPVFFRGVRIGEVVRIEGPELETPGYKLRMKVERSAFRQIPLDSPVRVDKVRGSKLRQVTILPGLEKPDWYFPGQVKVLREVTPEEEILRMIRDVIDGLVELSKSKTSEVELMQLREEVRKLNQQLQQMEAEKKEKENNAGHSKQ